MLEINAVIKIKQFLVVINLCLQKHAQFLEINAVVKINQFLVVISLPIKTRTTTRN